MFDFEGHGRSGSEGGIAIAPKRDSIFRVRSHPSDMHSIVSGSMASTAPNSSPSTSVQSSLNTSGMFNLDNANDGILLFAINAYVLIY